MLRQGVVGSQMVLMKVTPNDRPEVLLCREPPLLAVTPRPWRAEPVASSVVVGGAEWRGWGWGVMWWGASYSARTAISRPRAARPGGTLHHA